MNNKQLPKEIFPPAKFYSIYVDLPPEKVMNEFQRLGFKEETQFREAWLDQKYIDEQSQYDDFFLYVHEHEIHEIDEEYWEQQLVRDFGIPKAEFENIPHYDLSELIKLFEEQEKEDIEYVSKYGAQFKEILEDLPFYRQTEPVGFAAVQKNPNNILEIPDQNLSVRSLEEAFKRDGNLLNVLMISAKSLPNPFPDHLYDIALENGDAALWGVPDNKKTLERCKKGVQKNIDMLCYVLDKYLNREFYQWTIDVNKDRISLLGTGPELLREIQDESFYKDLVNIMQANFFNSLALVKKGEVPFDYFKLPSHLRTNELNMKAVKVNPKGYGQLYPKERTPEICLYAKKHYPYHFPYNTDIPDKVKHGKNIFSFHIELEKLTGREFSYEDTVDIYNGRPVKFKYVNPINQTTKEVLNKWDKEKHCFVQIKLKQSKTKEIKKGHKKLSGT